ERGLSEALLDRGRQRNRASDVTVGRGDERAHGNGQDRLRLRLPAASLRGRHLRRRHLRRRLRRRLRHLGQGNRRDPCPRSRHDQAPHSTHYHRVPPPSRIGHRLSAIGYRTSDIGHRPAAHCKLRAMKTLSALAVLFLLLPAPSFAQASSQVEFEMMTWPEVKAALAAGKTTALIYTGGTEHRGPQNVNGGHNLMARETVKAIAQ